MKLVAYIAGMAKAMRGFAAASALPAQPGMGGGVGGLGKGAGTGRFVEKLGARRFGRRRRRR